jgi:hypothetical protein
MAETSTSIVDDSTHQSVYVVILLNFHEFIQVSCVILILLHEFFEVLALHVVLPTKRVDIQDFWELELRINLLRHVSIVVETNSVHMHHKHVRSFSKNLSLSYFLGFFTATTVHSTHDFSLIQTSETVLQVRDFLVALQGQVDVLHVLSFLVATLRTSVNLHSVACKDVVN